MRIVLNSFGLFLGKKGDRFIIKNGNSRKEFPASTIEEIFIMNPGISFSIDAIKLALKKNVFIILCKSNGWPYGFIIPSKVSGSIKAKREQFKAYYDFRGIHLAKMFAIGKMFNQANLLKIFWKNNSRKNPDLAKQLYEASILIANLIKNALSIDGNCIDDIRLNIMNIEAEAARIYWNCVSKIVPSELKFPGRITRGASDPLNCMLNYGYKAMLFPEVWKSLYYVGLDPYAGFLHADRPGKPSLVLDLMEEFRQQAIDRVVFSIVNKRMIDVNNIISNEGTLLDNIIKILFKKIDDQFSSQVFYNGSKIPLRNIIWKQSRKIVQYLLGDIKEYNPYILKW